MNQVLLGGIAVAAFAIGVFFWHYWRASRDRFFLFFALSFWLETGNRIYVGIAQTWNEDSAAQYVVRLISYALIVYAIWDKNRARRP
jgi:Family of unknown function (DUF5985)